MSAESPENLKSIGKYEILEVIGEGGFGTVYKARDPLMERMVAIKVCMADDEQVRKRFLREAKIAGGLDHPNIVIAFDFGTEKGLPYLVQELLTGEDLRKKILRHEQIDDATKLSYLVQIAKGLQYAHTHGVLHRDVKPANVQILDDNRVKLMDFGMAKLSSETGTRLTQAGSVMGTAGYFSPEQLMALELDNRVDVFSYGVLAYELLTYCKAFPGDSFMVVFRQVLHDEPQPVSTLRPECPSELAGLVEKCMKKDREERFSGFDEILPILFTLIAQAPFDRRSRPREAQPTTPPAATLMMPRPHLAAPVSQPVDATVGAEAPALAPEPAVSDTPVSSPGPASVPEPRPAVTPRAHAVKRRKPLSIPRLPAALRQLPPRWLLAGGAGLALIVALGFWLSSSAREDLPISAGTATLETAPIDHARSQVAGPVGLVYAEAVPWGEIVRIVDQEGRELPLPEVVYTPSALRLAPGSYEIVIASPDSDTSASCRIEVVADEVRRCFAELGRLEVSVYFKEAGWWP